MINNKKKLLYNRIFLMIMLFTLSSHIVCFNILSNFVVYAAQSEVIYVDEKGNEQETKMCTVVESSSTILGNGGQISWYTVNKNVNASDRITIKGTVNLILADGYTLTAPKGIYVPEGSALYIWGQQNMTGKLKAQGKENRSAAIGGIGYDTAGKIIINGGTIEAHGAVGSGGAGIGGGFKGDFELIEINAGNISATGGKTSAAIGAGGMYENNMAGNIKLNGGNINAQVDNSPYNKWTAWGFTATADTIGNSAYYNANHRLNGGGISSEIAQNIRYTVTIPSKIALGEDINVCAENVQIQQGMSFNLNVSSDDYQNGYFILKSDNDDIIRYSLIKSGINVRNGDSVLMLDYGTTSGTSVLNTVPVDNAANTDLYNGVLTFTISVE